MVDRAKPRKQCEGGKEGFSKPPGTRTSTLGRKFEVEQLSGQVPPGVELQVGLLPLGPWGEEDGGRPGVNKEVRRPNIFSPRLNTVLSIRLFGA